MTHKPVALLIHGLHMHGRYMHTLAKRLEQAGFATHAISYKSVHESIAAHSHRIHQYLLDHHHADTPLYLVGHSLGGLVIRHFLVNYPMWQVHRCVTLGTPHQGSVCANYANRLLPPLVRKAYPDALDGTCPLPPDGVEFGVIAGNRPIGLGLPLLSWHNFQHFSTPNGRQNRPHDGTVYVFESVLPNAADYLLLPVNHTGLIFSQAVAKQVVHFLYHGRFDRSYL